MPEIWSVTKLKPFKLHYRRAESCLENTASLKTPSSHRPDVNHNIWTLRANTGIINLHNHMDGIITYFLQSPLLSD